LSCEILERPAGLLALLLKAGEVNRWSLGMLPVAEVGVHHRKLWIGPGWLLVLMLLWHLLRLLLRISLTVMLLLLILSSVLIILILMVRRLVLVVRI
jgi:hypothetical protein